jgi:MFS family permease
MIAEKYSAKWVIWASVLVNVVFTILTPLASNISYIAVLVVRFIEGLGAVRFPYSLATITVKMFSCFFKFIFECREYHFQPFTSC